jgi:SAM-dependent methyltransferase
MMGGSFMLRLRNRLINRLTGADASVLPSPDSDEAGTHNEATRVAWLERALKEIPKGARILDAGAGEQRFKSFCAHLNYVSQDFGKYDGVGDQSGLQTGAWDQSGLDIVSDITAIPEPDSSFDAIMCVEVLEHLPAPILAIKEFSRLLRSGGELIITAPFCSLTHLAPYHFYTGFNRYFYEMHLPASGFEIVELAENGNFFEYLAQEIRRIPEMATIYSREQPLETEQAAAQVLLRMLGRFSEKGQSSAEMLHFGYHVRARKR